MVAAEEAVSNTSTSWISWMLAVLLVITGGAGYYFYHQQHQQLQTSRQALDTAEAEASKLSEQLRTSDLQRESLRQEADFANRTNASQKQQLTEFEQQIQTLRAENDRLDKLSKDQANELNAQKRQLDLAVSNLASASKKQEEQTAQLDALKQELSENKQAVNSLSGELSAKQESLQALSSIEDQYHAAREQLALQQAQNDDNSDTIAQLENRLQREGEAMDKLEQKLNQLSDEKETLVSRLRDGTTVIKLPEKILFASGSAELSPKGEKTLRLVAEALNSFPDHMISIQGHTDGRAITSRLRDKYPSNWELSTARASVAVRVLLDEGIDKARLQAVGYADTRPLVEEKNESDRANNRRIEILLIPIPASVKELQGNGNSNL